MAEVLPITFHQSSGEVRTKLEGVEWRFFFAWNNRHRFWTVSLYEPDLTPVFLGIRVTTGIRLNRQIVNPVAPPGRIVAVDTSGARQPPGRHDLRTGKVQILYLTSAEVAAHEASEEAANG